MATTAASSARTFARVDRRPEDTVEVAAWQFSVDGGAWHDFAPPACWEDLGVDRAWEGPGRFRTRVELPQHWRRQPADTSYRLRFEGVAYAATVRVDGSPAGRHRGAWDAFTVDVTEALVRRGACVVELDVMKAGGPTWPVRRTTAGFMPYVTGFLGGGVHRCVRLERGTREWLPDTVAVERVGDGTVRIGKLARARIALWAPDNPVIRQVPIGGRGGDRGVARFGVSTVDVGRNQASSEGPGHVYPRLGLTWGYRTRSLAPSPDESEARTELQGLKSLGFNGVKCCLYVPSQLYLDLCDEMGMLVWMELPLWDPDLDRATAAQVVREYRRIVAQLRPHPSIFAWTLGCELQNAGDEAFYNQLFDVVARMTQSPLIRENSGGGECYGGSLQERATFADTHFYCDLPFLRPTFDYFRPRWGGREPWLFGEYADADAMRDIPALLDRYGPNGPWWLSRDPAVNPQGARWDMNAPALPDRWTDLGLRSRAGELREGQRLQTLAHRKYTIETTRAYPEISGYAVTGVRDTPIATAGMFDDAGDLRYTGPEMAAFNSDTVLLLATERRRAWIAGGDRPSYVDRHWRYGACQADFWLGVSHFGSPVKIEHVEWTLRLGDRTLAGGVVVPERLASRLSTGVVTQLAHVSADLPPVTDAVAVQLEAAIHSGWEAVATNSWPLWLAPPIVDNPLAAVLLDECLRLGPGGDQLFAKTGDRDTTVAFGWSGRVRRHVESGGNAIIVVEPSDGLCTVACPFWREAMKLFEPSPLWNGFPHDGYTGLQFYGLGPDCALDIDGLATALGRSSVHPILRRLDARTLDESWYAAEWRPPHGGVGIVTTLRPQGGLGDQPSGLTRNIGGVQFLRAAIAAIAVMARA